MLKGPRLNYLLRLAIDLLMLALCFRPAWVYVFGNWPGWNEGIIANQFLVSVSIWYLSSRVFHFYTSVTLFSYSQEITSLLQVVALHLLMQGFILLFFVDQVTQYRNFILLYNATILISFPFIKYLFRVVVSYIRSQYKYVRKILVVGSSEMSSNFYRSGMLINNLQYTIVGFVGERSTSGGGIYLGTIDQLDSILQQHKVDEVFLALPSYQTEQINFVIEQCELQKVQVNVINDFNHLGVSSRKLTNYAGFPVVGLRYFPLDDAENRFFKRLFDILFSFIVIVVVLSWLIPIMGLLIKFGSRGPVFFLQERWGLNNKKIKCFKFRTMYTPKVKSEGDKEFRQTEKNDSRVTKLGRILRKTSLDELPQFINVLMGQMSVVGPRPHPIPLSLESKDIVQHYMHRHLVKPGITGWAQVNGSRGEIHNTEDMKKRVSFDLWYIENWSFWIDCQIIFQTIVNLIKGDEKAY